MIELCAGGGGASLGLEQAGFDPVMLIERESNACATLRLNRPLWPVIEGDIRATDFDQYALGEIDLLSGGLPCPPYSVAGKQRGGDDERDLFPGMLNIVDKVRPRAVIIENVRGLLAAKFRPIRDSVSNRLDGMGYKVVWNELNAANFGVPQRRKRAFMVALASPAKAFQWPTPSPPCQFVGPCLYDLMSEGGWEGADAWTQLTDNFRGGEASL